MESVVTLCYNTVIAPLEHLWKVLVQVNPVVILVRVVANVVSPCRLANLQAGLGVALLLEQLLDLLLVLGCGAEPDLLVVAAAAGNADGDVQFVRSQPRDDLQRGLCAAAHIVLNLGADAIQPAPLLLWRQLLHIEEQCLDGDAHLGLDDALYQIVHGLVVNINESGWCYCTLPRSH